MGAVKIIAHANREIQERLLLKNGADVVIYPEKQTAAWVTRTFGKE